MLATYLSQVRRLAQNPAAPVALYSDSDITLAINEARSQLAAEAACIRVMGSLAVTAGNQGPYAFTAINLSPAVGVLGVINVRTMLYSVGSGQAWIRPRPFEWFSFYIQNDPVPQAGPPAVWSVFGQGANGTIYFNLPDFDYTLSADTVCLPIPLVDDTTVEAIPPLWQSAVQYYAMYTILLGAQTGARVQEADKFLERYELFVKRARQAATPEVQPFIYSGVPSPVTANQLGQGQGGGPPPGRGA